jgi:hypothetical protein
MVSNCGALELLSLMMMVRLGRSQHVKVADDDGLLQPLGHTGIIDHAFFYADDGVIFLKANQQDLILTKAILDIFGKASRLIINQPKCLINLIQCGLEDSVTLLKFFADRLQPFPCKYLGIPLSTMKLKKEHLQPLIDKSLC